MGAAVYSDTVTLCTLLKVVSVVPSDFFTVRVMTLVVAPAIGVAVVAEAVAV